MSKADFIRDFIEKNNHWTTPSLTLAKILVAAEPNIFGESNPRNIDNARNIIRTVRNSHGEHFSNNKSSQFAERFHGYIEPDQNDYKPFVIPDTVTKLGIICDVHIPFQNKANLEAALSYLETKQIDGLLLNGDILDCYQVSSFIKDRRMRDLKQEFDMLRLFIEDISLRFNCPIFYKLGNHEERIENLVLKQSPELVHFLTFEDCLNDRGNFLLSDYNLTIIKDKRIIKYTDRLNILHGHEYRTGMFNPVGIARWLYMKARTNAACGHGHKKDSFAARNLNGHTVETHSIGCLCDMTPKYMPLNDWQPGFAYVRRTDTGYKFSNLLIDNGIVL